MLGLRLVTRCAARGGPLVFGTLVMATGSDPFAVAAFAALSLTMLVTRSCLDRCQGRLRRCRPEPQDRSLGYASKALDRSIMTAR